MKIHKPDTLITDANQALELLKEGNKRFVENNLFKNHDYENDREVLTKEGQKPFAVVICCSDSRVAPEVFFDQHQQLGDIFVIRNAGNVVDQTTLGSLEYAVEHLGSKLVVVCGHSACGAVTAAYEGGELPKNIQSIADIIQPAVDKGDQLDQVIDIHTENMVSIIRDDEIVKDFGVTIKGAHYDIHTGKVTWQ